MGESELQIFANRLKELRLKLGMSQTDFVKGVGITASSLSAYEKNLKNPSIGVAKRIAETHHVSLDWLCGLSDQESQKQELKTYSDILRILLLLDTNKNLNWRTESMKNEPDTAAIVFLDKDLAEMLDDEAKMKGLLLKGAIDEEVYSLWAEKTLNKYNIPIASGRPMELSTAEIEDELKKI